MDGFIHSWMYGWMILAQRSRKCENQNDINSLGEFSFFFSFLFLSQQLYYCFLHIKIKREQRENVIKIIINLKCTNI